MKILKHGKKPEDDLLYYSCHHCGCQFAASKRESQFYDGVNQHDSGWECSCPECCTVVSGNIKEVFDRFFKN